MPQLNLSRFYMSRELLACNRPIRTCSRHFNFLLLELQSVERADGTVNELPIGKVGAIGRDAAKGVYYIIPPPRFFLASMDKIARVLDEKYAQLCINHDKPSSDARHAPELYE